MAQEEDNVLRFCREELKKAMIKKCGFNLMPESTAEAFRQQQVYYEHPQFPGIAYSLEGALRVARLSARMAEGDFDVF